MSTEPTDPSPTLCCFLSQERVCGADCMAYLSDPPEANDMRGQTWARCHLLVNAHRAGKHLVVLANTLSSPSAPTPNQQIAAPRL